MAVFYPVILLGLLPIGVVVGLTALIDCSGCRSNGELSLDPFRFRKMLMAIIFCVALLCFAAVLSRYRPRWRFC